MHRDETIPAATRMHACTLGATRAEREATPTPDHKQNQTDPRSPLHALISSSAQAPIRTICVELE